MGTIVKLPVGMVFSELISALGILKICILKILIKPLLNTVDHKLYYDSKLKYFISHNILKYCKFSNDTSKYDHCNEVNHLKVDSTNVEKIIVAMRERRGG